MASIGTLVGFLRLDDTQYKRALDQNSSRTKSFTKNIGTSLGGLALRTVGPAALGAALIKLGKDSFDLAENFTRLAGRAGITTREMQVLDFVARKNRASGEDFAKVLDSLARNLSEAAGGSDTARDNFAALGLSWRTLQSQSPIGALEATARALQDATDKAGGYSAAAKILGTEDLAKLRTSLDELARDGFKGAESAADAFAQILPGRVTAAFDEAAVNLGIARRQFTGSFAKIFSDLADGRFVDALAGSLGIFSQEAGAALQQFADDSRTKTRAAADAAEENTIRFQYLLEGTKRVLRDFADNAAAGLVPGLEHGDAIARSLRDNLDQAAKEILLFGKIVSNLPGTAQATIFLTPEELQRAVDFGQELRRSDSELARLNREFDSTVSSIETALATLEQADTIRANLTANLNDTLRDAADQRSAQRIGAQLSPLRQILALEQEILRLRTAATDITRTPDQRKTDIAQILALENKIADLRTVEIPQLPGELLRDQTVLIQESFLRGEISAERMARALQSLEDAARPVKTPLEQISTETQRLDNLLADGLIDVTAHQRALQDLHDAARPVKTVTEQMATEQQRLNRLRSDGLISATAYTRALEDLAESARIATTPEERLALETRKLDRALADGVISPAAYRRSLEELHDSLRIASTPIEGYRLEHRRLRQALDAGFISQDAFNAAVADLGDNLRPIKSPLEAYRSELAALDRLQRDGVISAAALGRAITDAAKQAGSVRLGDIEEKIGRLGDTQTGRSAQRALDRARKNAERGNLGAAQDDLRRVEELLPELGQSIEELLGVDLVDSADKQAQAAARQAEAQAAATAAASRESEIQKNIADRWEKAGKALGIDLEDAAKDIPDDIAVDAPGSIPVDAPDNVDVNAPAEIPAVATFPVPIPVEDPGAIPVDPAPDVQVDVPQLPTFNFPTPEEIEQRGQQRENEIQRFFQDREDRLGRFFEDAANQIPEEIPVEVPESLPVDDSKPLPVDESPLPVDTPAPIPVDAPASIPLDIDNFLAALDLINPPDQAANTDQATAGNIPETAPLPPVLVPLPAPVDPNAAPAVDAALVTEVRSLVTALNDIASRLQVV